MFIIGAIFGAFIWSFSNKLVDFAIKMISKLKR